jgi:hypothetical protein
MRIARLVAITACLLAWSAAGSGQTPPATPVIPDNAAVLEGQPTVRVDASRAGAKALDLDAAEASKNRLKVRISEGRYYWSSRGDEPLTVSSSGAFTYLSSNEPGKYIRLTKVGDKLEYVEHVDKDFTSVTFWGELRVVMKK